MCTILPFISYNARQEVNLKILLLFKSPKWATFVCFELDKYKLATGFFTVLALQN